MSKIAQLLGLGKGPGGDQEKQAEPKVDEKELAAEKLAFCKEAAEIATAIARDNLRISAEVELQVEKIASIPDDQLEEQFGHYVKIGHDMACGYIAAMVKAAEGEMEGEEMSSEDAEIEELIETVEAQVAETLAQELVDNAGTSEVLDDPQVVEEIAAQAAEVAVQVVEEALMGGGGGEEEMPPEEEAPPEEVPA